MKNVKISYCEINSDLKNSVMEIALDYPNYKNNKKCYLYELFYFDEIEEKIRERESDIIQYNIINQDYMPFFIKISDECFDEINDYLKSETEYEECKWNDEVSLLQAILHIYRNDPKSWE